MPLTPHIERHFTAGEVVRDVVIGIALQTALIGGLAAAAAFAIARAIS